MKTGQRNWRWLGLSLLLFAAVPPVQAFYDPGLQRWITRDPSGEGGGWNIHAFLQNAPITYHDSFGLEAGLRTCDGKGN